MEFTQLDRSTGDTAPLVLVYPVYEPLQATLLLLLILLLKLLPGCYRKRNSVLNLVYQQYTLYLLHCKIH